MIYVGAFSEALKDEASVDELAWVHQLADLLDRGNLSGLLRVVKAEDVGIITNCDLDKT